MNKRPHSRHCEPVRTLVWQSASPSGQLCDGKCEKPTRSREENGLPHRFLPWQKCRHRSLVRNDQWGHCTKEKAEQKQQNSAFQNFLHAFTSLRLMKSLLLIFVLLRIGFRQPVQCPHWSLRTSDRCLHFCQGKKRCGNPFPLRMAAACVLHGASGGRIATPVCALVRNDGGAE